MWYAREILRQNPDFAFTNGGNIRAALPEGDVTREDIATVLPFDNWMYITKMKGSEITALFEFIASIPQGAGGWAQVSEEVRYTIDYSAGFEKGVLKDLSIHGAPVDPDAEYTFITNDYLMSGGDGYTILANNISSYNTSTTLRDAVTEYVKHMKILSPETDGRITVIGGLQL
ncbi:5'-nucleotidase C-terminal domain-containing protein [Brucepastera parasyntrophica]|uniref:5'-nucleotidase C-terminal domain-containing protein n=1 Tax=Brucepastera parasyntrophica TaxID=2880008 RepID=UPI00210A8045|nr:5'-nucleotidase C-terminal domain-containing protein [Brucepastera parasyntrophica]ULQ61179.1 5'-nucleotidase C-terminal domain-containing protein [Brucepastera parasyntrophica]